MSLRQAARLLCGLGFRFGWRDVLIEQIYSPKRIRCQPPVFIGLFISLSPKRQALKGEQLVPYAVRMSPAENAISRIRDEMRTRQLSQRDIAERLKCSQGRIAKILNARVNLRVQDLGELAQAVGITLTEAVRDRGLEFYAEMTPTEVRVLERLRQRPDTLHAVMTLLDVVGPTINATATAAHRHVGRPQHAKLQDRLHKKSGGSK